MSKIQLKNKINVYLLPIGFIIWSSIVSNEESCWRKLPHTWQANCGNGDFAVELFVVILSKKRFYVVNFYTYVIMPGVISCLLVVFLLTYDSSKNYDWLREGQFMIGMWDLWISYQLLHENCVDKRAEFNFYTSKKLK